jgi:hypothetical protein
MSGRPDADPPKVIARIADAAALELRPKGSETLATTIAAPGASSTELRASLESVRTVVERSLELAGASI